MATTSTYNFNPATSGLVMSAFARIGIRRTEMTAQHLADADVESNLIQVELSNRIPNLWAVELFEEELDADQSTVTLPARFIAFQAAYLTIESGGVSYDRLLFPYSTFEFSAVPDKSQSGPPTAYWLSTVIPPVVTLWPIPDEDATYTFKGRIVRQIQDASLINGLTAEVPYRWLDVWVSKLAHRMARIYAPDKEQLREADAEKAWAIAATTDQEQVPLYISGNTSAYWR